MTQPIKLLILLCTAFAICTGDCISSCMQYCWTGGSVQNPAACNGELHRCEIACRDNRSYGAIAYSAKEKGKGWSYAWDNQGRAEKVAMDNCAAHGSHCKIIVWFYNSCGAVAADGDVVAWGRDAAKPRAEQTALAECSKAGGRRCVIQASQCSR